MPAWPRSASSIEQLLWKATAVFIVFGAIDWVRQRHRYMKGLRMTKQELKEEVKDMEGNPQVRGKIKRLRRDLLRRRMMKEVPTATAVIVNPTHYAVALRYSHESMAPAGGGQRQELSGVAHPPTGDRERRGAGGESSAGAGAV